ncbi:cobalamin (vitamin B12) biosynthesis CbiX protein [Isosphaera pallida ATCC 43644]|uniref:Cobalamin (Vitamin B12) biosynthesis CbiX protein n=1 Tax=Isosphaera pallida (strain ATCC 43644 / DSM 9630 / IS1B) TaxID=575540 RepID=E8R3L6_ISOPI|nr:CbiX/SirB N-terminal domain-containing protein [Isosphaera pallida]ADV61583.1 cobalamin (vitamin B12) biosynthesis CbiX protein [Isosphaera pallida ATCC 43644]
MMSSATLVSFPPDTAILLIAHGSRHQPANDDLIALADRLATREGWTITVPCFLELAEPDIAAGGAECVRRGARRVVMVPYFLSMGVHLTRDLTAARDELAQRFPEVQFHLGPPLGPDPALDDLVVRRARELVETAWTQTRAD